MLGNAVLYSFTDGSAAVWPAECTASSLPRRLARCTEQTQREATLCRESQTSCSGLATSSNSTIRFILKSRYVCIFYGKTAANRVWKLLNIVLKSRSWETWDLMQRTVDICGGECGYCGWLLITFHKLITKHQWLVHSLCGQKYWHPFFRREKALPKLWQRWKHNSCT